ncbi:hypothetical protein KIPB_013375, partial [Kipferlia bialata]|eukprot:g13375.t1
MNAGAIKKRIKGLEKKLGKVTASIEAAGQKDASTSLFHGAVQELKTLQAEFEELNMEVRLVSPTMKNNHDRQDIYRRMSQLGGRINAINRRVMAKMPSQRGVQGVLNQQ